MELPSNDYDKKERWADEYANFPKYLPKHSPHKAFQAYPSKTPFQAKLKKACTVRLLDNIHSKPSKNW